MNEHDNCREDMRCTDCGHLCCALCSLKLTLPNGGVVITCCGEETEE